MPISTNLIIANLLSGVTACFTLASAWTKHPQRTYLYQVAQCLVYAVAAYFFGVYSCIVMMLINATRNYLVARQKFTLPCCVLFCMLAVGLGLWVNQSGLSGLLSVFATVEYTILSFALKDAKAVKINVIINLAIWLFYDILVRDIFSCAVDVSGTILAIISLIRMLAEERQSGQISE